MSGSNILRRTGHAQFNVPIPTIPANTPTAVTGTVWPLGSLVRVRAAPSDTPPNTDLSTGWSGPIQSDAAGNFQYFVTTPAKPGATLWVCLDKMPANRSFAPAGAVA